MLSPGSPWVERVVQEFGSGLLRSDGSLDRSALAQIIFSDPEARNRLNALLHPPVLAEITRRLEELRGNASPPAVAVVVAPLLFETGAEKLMEKVIVVIAPEQERIRRLKKRDGLTEAEIRARFAAQLPPDQSRARADWVIDNSGDLSETEWQVDNLCGELISSL